MLASITKAEIVYSKEHEGGTLYALIHTHPKKKHSTLDKNISAMDVILKTTTNTSTTFFKSISAQYEGKVKTFEVTEHIDDPLFHVIFNVQESGAAIGRKFNIQQGVQQYSEHQDSQATINQEHLDLILQKSADGKHGGEYSIATKQRLRAAESDDGASGSAMVVDAVAQPVSEEIEGLQRELAAKNGEISTLNSDIADKRIEIDLLKDNIANKDTEIVALKAHVASACMQMVQLAQESSPEIAQISRFNQRLYNEAQHLQDEIKVKTKRAEKLDNKRLDTITKLEKDNEQLKDRVFDLEGQVERLPR
jgi:hypothetical protein